MEENKKYKYRGKTIDELKAMPLEEFVKLLPSRERRKIQRGFTESENIFLRELRKNKGLVKTHVRDMVVLPEMVGRKIAIYNGKEFVTINIIEEMIGMRFGELAPTRKVAVHTSVGAKKKVVRK